MSPAVCFPTPRNFDALFGDDTADSPRWASRWAAESVALLQSVSAAYAFRFSTNPDSANANSKIKKVGARRRNCAAAGRVAVCHDILRRGG